MPGSLHAPSCHHHPFQVAFLWFVVQHSFVQLLANLTAHSLMPGLEWGSLRWRCLLYMIFFNALTGWWAAWMAWVTLYNAGCNVTLNEQWSCGRRPYHDYCRKSASRGFITRFDYGFWCNLFDFFVPERRRQWYVAFSLEDVKPVTEPMVRWYFMALIGLAKDWMAKKGR